MSRNSKTYAWFIVGLLWVVALLNYMDRQLLSTMKSAMMVDIDELSSSENFGKLMAIFLWIYGFFSPIAGLIADRVNRKFLIVGSLCVWSGVTLLMGITNDFNTLYLLRAVMGFSEALYIPASLALIADYHKDTTRSLAIGVHMTGLYVGQALGGFGATIASGYTWQTTFQLFGLVGLAYCLVLLVFLHEPRGTASAKMPENRARFSIASTLSAILGTISFWVFLFYFAAPSIPGWAVKNWMPTLFSSNLGIEMAIAGPMATIAVASSSFVGVIFGGILSDRWVIRNIRGRVFTSAIGLALTIPAMLFFGLGNGLFWVIGGVILFGIGYGMFDANNMPILAQFVAHRYRAAAYGILNMVGVFSGALITWLLGISSDSGNLGRDMVFLSIPVAIAITLQLAVLKPNVINME